MNALLKLLEKIHDIGLTISSESVIWEFVYAALKRSGSKIDTNTELLYSICALVETSSPPNKAGIVVVLQRLRNACSNDIKFSSMYEQALHSLRGLKAKVDNEEMVVRSKYSSSLRKTLKSIHTNSELLHSINRTQYLTLRNAVLTIASKIYSDYCQSLSLFFLDYIFFIGWKEPKNE